MHMHWVDVFATEPMAGNPLAVVTGEQWPSPAAMQRLAGELGLSETVFARPGATPRLRIFTPESEIPLAGHPLVGTAWVLRRIGWIGDRGRLDTPGGVIDVTADDRGATMTRHAPRHAGDADPAALAECLGARAQGDAPIWDAGLPQAMLEVDDLDALRPDHDAVRAAGAREGWAGASAYVLQASGPRTAVARVRHFAAPIGIAEDPVTGSAAGALGARLAASGMAGGDGVLDLTVLQGHALGRAGEVRVRVSMAAGVPGEVEVGGAVVPIMDGGVEPGALRG